MFIIDSIDSWQVLLLHRELPSVEVEVKEGVDDDVGVLVDVDDEGPLHVSLL